MSKTISNPILPGFNPDPSIVRVGEDYYIATSTFEWFPGVQIHHSRDLVNWRLLRRSLSLNPIIFNNWQASRVTTTLRSSIISTSRTMTLLASMCA